MSVLKRRKAAEPGLIFLVLGLTLATVATIALVVTPRMAQGRVVFGTKPDRPCPFGYRMAWFAVRTRDTRGVVEALGLTRVQSTNWRSGIGSVYDDKIGETHVFVSPPINGWTFVVGLPLPHPSGASFVDKFMPLFEGLGRRFVEVQYYSAYPLIGDEGVVLNLGKTTKDERSLGLKLFELRGVKGRKGDAGGAIILHPTEEHVMRLAGRWGIDPINIERAPAGELALGVIGIAPASWRPERARKAEVAATNQAA
jgi:hypothetical protein